MSLIVGIAVLVPGILVLLVTAYAIYRIATFRSAPPSEAEHAEPVVAANAVPPAAAFTAAAVPSTPPDKPSDAGVLQSLRILIAPTAAVPAEPSAAQASAAPRDVSPLVQTPLGLALYVQPTLKLAQERRHETNAVGVETPPPFGRPSLPHVAYFVVQLPPNEAQPGDRVSFSYDYSTFARGGRRARARPPPAECDSS